MSDLSLPFRTSRLAPLVRYFPLFICRSQHMLTCCETRLGPVFLFDLTVRARIADGPTPLRLSLLEAEDAVAISR